MTIYSDDLVRIANHVVGSGTAVFAAYDAITGSGMASRGIPQVCCGVLLVYTAGIFQDYLRRRDTRVVAYLSGNPDAPLSKISFATGMNHDRVASSLQRLISDGLVVAETGPSALTRYYRLAS
ncbi:helix-turn-helix domain-containing protein [Streptomyces sp. WAC08241]|uniref:MarR family transcriptional regulator n=1 Tax=Streptomyces sp. WAC08241 TaxID=2487421 RepID=UPI000F7A0DEB|nr:helix-turn-helix domain-containing protein [Streptomyces sp. WAC08241]RSS46244.1 MarR family transcriptional regulator [Streptomyces sp. WAC08241]